jgi:signal transduction histidine kinase
MAGAVSFSILHWAVLTVSFFITISLLWLGFMVVLAGNRRSAGTWLTGSGLLLGALFFTSHTAILGRGLSNTSFGMDFWWWVSWTPAVAAPLAWYGSLLWYSGYRLDRPHDHHTWMVLVLFLAACLPLLLVFANPLPSYQYVVGHTIVGTPGIAGIPLLLIVYVAYSLLCYLLPLDLLRRAPAGLPLEARARQRARPYLVAASLALSLAGVFLAWTALWALTAYPIPSLSDMQTERTVLRFDLAVETLVALAVTLLGRAIVGFEVFTGRPLPRNRFLRQWRSTVILAGGFGAAAAFTLSIHLPPIYSLMLATGLMTLFYVLYSWRSFVEREEFMERLRPFVASQNLYSQLTAAQDADDNSSPSILFETLCREVLEIRQAVLAPTGALATFAGPPLVYPARERAPDGAQAPDDAQASFVDLPAWQLRFSRLEGSARPVPCLPVEPDASEDAGAPAGAEWAVPLWSSRGLDGILFLGEKINRNPFTEEEIDIAQTGGGRLLDLLAGTEMARIAMDMLRQRLAQARVIEGQGRRVLHDEVLPELHTALLHLSSLRAQDHPGAPPEPQIQQAMDCLTTAHRQIADLMREMPLPAPHQLAQGGLVSALRGLVERDFAGDFHSVEWDIQPQAAAHARELPLFVSEVLYFAARELLRNASIHGRGADPDARLHLKIGLALVNDAFCLSIEDDGAGFRQEPSHTPARAGDPGYSGAGSGLRLHSTMLAAVGARLEVLPSPEKGTRAIILAGQPAKKY